MEAFVCGLGAWLKLGGIHFKLLLLWTSLHLQDSLGLFNASSVKFLRKTSSSFYDKCPCSKRRHSWLRQGSLASFKIKIICLDNFLSGFVPDFIRKSLMLHAEGVVVFIAIFRCYLFFNDPALFHFSKSFSVQLLGMRPTIQRRLQGKLVHPVDSRYQAEW